MNQDTKEPKKETTAAEEAIQSLAHIPKKDL